MRLVLNGLFVLGLLTAPARAESVEARATARLARREPIPGGGSAASTTPGSSR